MIKFLIKKFINNNQNTDDEVVRGNYGVLAGCVGIASNAVLCIFKILVGFMANAVSIIADAVNNLSDMGTSIVTVWGFKLSSQPADNEHPYGHARYEYITGLIVSVIILIIGILLGKSSIERLINPEDNVYKWYTFVVLALSILIKLWQMYAYRYISNVILSDALKANSKDSLNDVISTSVVLVTSVIDYFFNVNLDAIAGILVALFIVYSSIKLLKEMSNPLLGEKPSKDLVKKITDKISSYDIVLGYHDLMIHNYGPQMIYASMHVELPSDLSFNDAHDLLDNIEFDFQKDLNVHISLHPDPVDCKDEFAISLKEKVVEVLSTVESVISIHDFRLVKGKNHINVVFDAVIKFGSKITSKDIEYLLNKNITDGNYHFHINIDRSYSED